MMKIDQIWDELLNDKSFTQGILLRRYSASILPDVFVALQQPESLFCLASSVSAASEIDLSYFENLQEISIELVPDPDRPKRKILLFKLINNQHKDIFSVLCEDLIVSIAAETSELQWVKTLLNRFEKWKSLFTRIAAEGLSAEEQRGLFGELYFLRKFLSHNFTYSQVLDSWIGPSGEVRDFQMSNWAVEVKTTYGNNHQKIQVSSERQLDITNIKQLYLYHVSLERVQHEGESLNQIVNSIKGTLSSDTVALNRFHIKLYETGYFERHTALYDSIGYFIRRDTFYLVRDNFPRIQESEIRSGVGDVKYSIILSQCESYKLTEEIVFENLRDK